MSPLSPSHRSDRVHTHRQHGVRSCSRGLHDPPQRTRHHGHPHLPPLAVLQAHRRARWRGAHGRTEGEEPKRRFFVYECNPNRDLMPPMVLISWVCLMFCRTTRGYFCCLMMGKNTRCFGKFQKVLLFILSQKRWFWVINEVRLLQLPSHIQIILSCFVSTPLFRVCKGVFKLWVFASLAPPSGQKRNNNKC